jgi:hypothetical protein
MKAFQPKYSPAQWQAIYDARFARGLEYSRIATLAIEGELTGEPFEITATYIGEKCRHERKRRAGKNRRPIADLATKDANDFMRQSLLNLWDSERVELERQKPGKRDVARLEQLAKTAIVIARIPGQKDLAPKNPANRQEDGRRAPELRGGTAGALLKALHATTPPDEPDEPEAPAATPRTPDTPQGTGSGSLTHGSDERAA